MSKRTRDDDAGALVSDEVELRLTRFSHFSRGLRHLATCTYVHVLHVEVNSVQGTTHAHTHTRIHTFAPLPHVARPSSAQVRNRHLT